MGLLYLARKVRRGAVLVEFVKLDYRVHAAAVASVLLVDGALHEKPLFLCQPGMGGAQCRAHARVG